MIKLVTGAPQRLTIFLDSVERFLGDAGMANRTLFPHAFGLRAPTPLWTAPAFDRCLLLALIYPIATIFVVWAIFGHVGPAEAALRLNPDVPGWSRGLIAAANGFSSFALWRGVRAQGWKSRVWITVGVAFAFAVTCDVAVTCDFAGGVAGAGAIAFAFVGAGAFAFAGAVAFAVAVAGAGAVAGASAFARSVAGASAFAGAVALVVAVVFAIAFAGDLAVALVIAVVFTFAFSALKALAIKHRWHGFFLSLLLPAMILACLAAAAFLSNSETWGLAGPLVLFMGLLTLFNAPFDWASLGLTRALLRRGLELGGWWPYLLALMDAESVAFRREIAMLAREARKTAAAVS